MNIGIIVGSTREGNVGQSVGKWLLTQGQTRKHKYELIEVSTFRLPLLGEGSAKDNIQRWQDKIKSLDGFIFVAAEYNHSITASLKNALDLTLEPWANKAAGIVSYGYAGGARAAEHLRTILGALAVADVQQHVMFNLNTEFLPKEGFKPAPYQIGLVGKLFDQVERWSEGLLKSRS